MPRKKVQKVEEAMPLATSSPTTSINSTVDEEEAVRRDEILDCINKKFDNIKRKYEQEMFKVKMSNVDLLDKPYTIDILPDEELEKLELLHFKSQTSTSSRTMNSQLNEASGVFGVATPCVSGVRLNSVLTCKTNAGNLLTPLPQGDIKKATFATQTPGTSKIKRFLRKPMFGEKALSMNGSPLLIASDPVEAAAHLLLTTSDGKTMVLVPTNENSIGEDDLPEISPQAANELLQIGNLINNIVRRDVK